MSWKQKASADARELAMYLRTRVGHVVCGGAIRKDLSIENFTGRISDLKHMGFQIEGTGHLPVCKCHGLQQYRLIRLDPVPPRVVTYGLRITSNTYVLGDHEGAVRGGLRVHRQKTAIVGHEAGGLTQDEQGYLRDAVVAALLEAEGDILARRKEVGTPPPIGWDARHNVAGEMDAITFLMDY